MWRPSWDIASQLLLREHVSSKGVALFFPPLHEEAPRDCDGADVKNHSVR